MDVYTLKQAARVTKIGVETLRRAMRIKLRIHSSRVTCKRVKNARNIRQRWLS